jgi:ADP-ribose pyrophosphatase YjhB (NUDIX family)
LFLSGANLTSEESTVVRDSEAKTAFHAVFGVVFQVREGRLEVLLWQRAREPFAGAWSLPGGTLDASESLEQSIRRQFAAKVDVRELLHLEQLETLGEPNRNPARWELATAYLGLIPSSADPAIPDDTRWHPVDRLPRLAFDHKPIVHAGRERLRAKLSYTNIGYALAPETFTIADLRQLYAAALGHDVTATNLRRVLLRRGLLEVTGDHREPGREGGRPAAVFRFRERTLAITDQFAVLRPPNADIASR